MTVKILIYTYLYLFLLIFFEKFHVKKHESGLCTVFICLCVRRAKRIEKVTFGGGEKKHSMQANRLKGRDTLCVGILPRCPFVII